MSVSVQQGDVSVTFLTCQSKIDSGLRNIEKTSGSALFKWGTTVQSDEDALLSRNRWDFCGIALDVPDYRFTTWCGGK